MQLHQNIVFGSLHGWLGEIKEKRKTIESGSMLPELGGKRDRNFKMAYRDEGGCLDKSGYVEISVPISRLSIKTKKKDRN